ncbi:MAG TPA: hypothetical protein VF814_06970, partial [Casimicrobiaceae bacterium]
HYALQEFRAAGCASAALLDDRRPSFLTEAYAAAIAPRFASLQVRREQPTREATSGTTLSRRLRRAS